MAPKLVRVRISFSGFTSGGVPGSRVTVAVDSGGAVV
jgi:hypothetical protein